MYWEIAKDFMSPIIAMLLGFLLSRKTRKVEVDKGAASVDSDELDNVEKAIKIWREMSKDLEARLKLALDEIHELRDKVKKCQEHSLSIKPIEKDEN